MLIGLFEYLFAKVYAVLSVIQLMDFWYKAILAEISDEE